MAYGILWDDAVQKKSNKMKAHVPNRLNFWYWFILKFLLEQDTKRYMLYLSNAPLNGHNFLIPNPTELVDPHFKEIFMDFSTKSILILFEEVIICLFIFLFVRSFVKSKQYKGSTK